MCHYSCVKFWCQLRYRSPDGNKITRLQSTDRRGSLIVAPFKVVTTQQNSLEETFSRKILFVWRSGRAAANPRQIQAFRLGNLCQKAPSSICAENTKRQRAVWPMLLHATKLIVVGPVDAMLPFPASPSTPSRAWTQRRWNSFTSRR